MAKKKQPQPEKLAVAAAPLHDLPPPMLEFALQYLRYYGWLGGDPTPGATTVAARWFQEAAGIEPDGVIGPQTLETMWLPRCGCRDDAYTQATRWKKRKLAWWVDKYLAGISRGDQNDIQDLVAQDIMSVVDIELKRAPSREQADLIFGVGQGRANGFDGPGGVLAWAQLPPGDERQLLMMFDETELWILVPADGRGILVKNVLAHEWLHLLGVFHINGPKALMNALYDPAVATMLDPDKKALWELGYAQAQPTPTPPPAPPPTTPAAPGGVSRVILEIQGKITGALMDGWDTRRK